MSVWFEGSREIDCSIQQVKDAIANHGEHYVGVISLMPGLTKVELVEEGPDFVTIRTNEGLMQRTNISSTIEADRVVIEFDEVYQAGSMVTASSHFRDEFSANDGTVTYQIIMSGVEAGGLIGFIYRKFGSSNIGNAFLASYKAYLEQRAG